MSMVGSSRRIRIGFVLHVMQVAGAEVLVSELVSRLGDHLEPSVLCLDRIGPLGETLIARGVPVQAFGRLPGLDWRLVRRMASEIRRLRLDVLHAHQYAPFLYGGLAARLSNTGTRVVFTEHGRHWPDVVSRKRRLANRLVLGRLANHVTAVCQFSADALRRVEGLTNRPIEIIENGIQPENYRSPRRRQDLRRDLGLAPDRPLIVCVARFHPVKDHRTLVRAFRLVADSCEDVDLALVGDGELRAEITRLAEELGLGRRVHFLGVRQDVPELLGASDVFVLASVSEAASITLLEAMATGLPIVATNVGGTPELVRGGTDGLLVARGDFREMASAVVRLLRSPEEAAAMGARGRERVYQQFHIDRTASRYLALFERASAALTGRRS